MKTVDGLIKTKILGYFKKHGLEDLYINEFISEVGYKKAKYTDIDILNYLCDAFDEAILKQNQTENTIQKIVLAIYGIFVQIVCDKKVLKQEVYDKVLSTENKYNNYFDENNLEKSSFVINFINKVNSAIETSKKEKVNIQLVNDDGSLKEEKEGSKKNTDEIKEFKNRIIKLEKEIEKSKTKIEDKKGKIRELTKRVKELNNEYEKLVKKLNESESKNIILKDELESLYLQINELNKTINNFSEEIKSNKESMDLMLNSDEYIIGKRKQEEDKIDDDILKLIFNKEVTVSEILEKYPDYSSEEVRNSLIRLGEKYKIESQEITIPRKYRIQKLTPDINKKITLPVNSSGYIDVMFISDLHIDEENLNNVERRLNKVYDYCTLNNINSLINLGDFIDKEFSDLTVYDQNKKIISLLDKTSKLLPLSESINHFILGGNHDDRILYYGLDPLKYISERRDDIINLGYYKALLEYTYKDAHEYILLHHKGLPTENYNYLDADSILKTYSSTVRNKETKGDLYLQVFGHLHQMRIDSQKGYVIVPSLIKGEEYENGALQARIYFDENGNINNILFIPLIYTNSNLKKCGEIPYTKIKKTNK